MIPKNNKTSAVGLKVKKAGEHGIIALLIDDLIVLLFLRPVNR
jgi:hypothetical protein